MHNGRAIIVILGTLLCFLPAVASDGEDAIKVAAVLVFVQHAHWPDPLPGVTPLRICTVGRPEFVRALRTGLDSRLVEGHPLQVTEVKQPFETHSCQVMYLATEKIAEIKSILQSIAAAHTLTIGETDRFLEFGGAANLFLEDGRIAFEVSLGALDRQSIEISSKLLRFGQIRDLAKGKGKTFR